MTPDWVYLLFLGFWTVAVLALLWHMTRKRSPKQTVNETADIIWPTDYHIAMADFERRILEQKRKHQSTKKILREREAYVREQLLANVGFK